MKHREHSRSPGHSGCVVIVDDDQGLRQMFSLALGNAGFEVVEAASRLDLQRYLAQNRPDAMVIDLQRSAADGLDLLVRMRARHKLRDVPILFLASSDADDFGKLALRAGADWFGLRPLRMAELQNQVSALIQQRRAAQPARRSRRSPQLSTLERAG